MKINIKTDDGVLRRLALPDADWTGNEKIATGLFLRALYLLPEENVLVAETYSYWQNLLTNGTVGQKHEIVTMQTPLAFKMLDLLSPAKADSVYSSDGFSASTKHGRISK